MEFFKDKDANLYEQSSHDYFDYLKGLYCEIYSGKLPGVKDDGTIIGQIREEHSMFIENCNSKLSKIFFSAVIKGYLGKSIQRFVIAVLF